MAKHRALVQGIKFNIDTEFLINIWERQNGCCAISGRVFDLSRPDKHACKQNAPSLDKINPEEGYVKGNVRFVCYQVNTALNEYGEESLIALCKDILKFKEGVLA